MINRLILVITLLLSVGCKTMEPYPESDSCGFVLNQAGKRLTWAKLPIVIGIDKSVPNEYMKSITFAISKWNESGTTFFILSNTIPANIVVFNVASSWDRFFGEQAITRVFWSDATIKSAKVIINSDNFKFYTGTTGKEYSLDSLMVHELGHAIGLAHHDGTVMDQYMGKAAYRADLSSHELKAIKCGYK